MVVALGVAWILDGLEITVASAAAAQLTSEDTLGLSTTQVGLMATVYLAGEVFGALFFGSLADRLGRRKLFIITLAVYLIGSGLTALTIGNGIGSLAFLYATRFIAGMGIGGEYAAINSAIDELIPARFRGRVDLMVNGTYWAGAIIGTLGTFIFLNQLEPSIGWRVAFLLGPVLGLVIIFVRRHLPESPRWQVMHGHEAEAEKTIAYIEHEVEAGGRELPKVSEDKAVEITPAEKIGYFALARVLFKEYPQRAIYGATLMITQSFLYNAIFFTYTLVLTNFYGVEAEAAPLFLIAFAVGNLAGPFVLGHLFDTVGRKKMISGTYILSGVLLAITAFLFQADVLTAVTQTIAWCADLLLRLGGSQRRIPHGQRDLPAGGPGEGDRGLLRHRPVLRCPGTGDLRRADRRRDGPAADVLRLPARRRRHDRRWSWSRRSSASTPRTSPWRTSRRRCRCAVAGHPRRGSGPQRPLVVRHAEPRSSSPEGAAAPRSPDRLEPVPRSTCRPCHALPERFPPGTQRGGSEERVWTSCNRRRGPRPWPCARNGPTRCPSPAAPT